MNQNIRKQIGIVITLILVLASTDALARARIQSAPTLSEWSIIILASLLALSAAYFLRRHRQ